MILYVVFVVIGVVSSATAAAIGMMLVFIRIAESMDNNDEEHNEDFLVGYSFSDKD